MCEGYESVTDTDSQSEHARPVTDEGAWWRDGVALKYVGLRQRVRLKCEKHGGIVSIGTQSEVKIVACSPFLLTLVLRPSLHLNS